MQWTSMIKAVVVVAAWLRMVPWGRLCHSLPPPPSLRDQVEVRLCLCLWLRTRPPVKSQIPSARQMLTTPQVLQSVEVVSLSGVLCRVRQCVKTWSRPLCFQTWWIDPLCQFYSVSLGWEKCGMPASSPRQRHPRCSQEEALLQQWAVKELKVIYFCGVTRITKKKKVLNAPIYFDWFVVHVCGCVSLSPCSVRLRGIARRVKLCFSHV